MKPGSFLLVVMLLHLSLCFLASVSYQWSEQIATASMPRAHRAKERPAYSSNLPAAIPQLHRNTMDIFTTGKALERETTQKTSRAAATCHLAETASNIPNSCGSHPRCGGMLRALQSSAPGAVLESHLPLLLCGGDLVRRNTAFHLEREQASDPLIQRCPSPSPRAPRQRGLKGYIPPEET